MTDIKCPKCNRQIKLVECVCKTKDRKRIMISFPCLHFLGPVYNVPISTDNNTILKHFESVREDFFNDPDCRYNRNERYV